MYLKNHTAVAESNLVELGTNPAPWTPEEQKLLEQAMRTYGASVENRWDKIADAIADRSKKDCMKRYKVETMHYSNLIISSLKTS